VEEKGHFKIFDPVKNGSSVQYGGKNESALGPEPPSCGDPVDCATGNYYETQTDLAVGGRGVGLDLARTYNSQAAAGGDSGAFGAGWSNSFSDHLTVGQGKATLTQANGSTVPFAEGKGEAFAPPAWSQDTLSGNAKAGYSVVLPNQVKYQFEGATGRLQSVSDRNGNQTKLGYGKTGLLETITDPAGRKITLAYNGEGFVESAKDPMGHTAKYTYSEGNLASVTLPGETKARWQYHYGEAHQMTLMIDRRKGETTNEYNASHQLTSQTDPAGHKLKFEYEPFHTKVTNNTTGAVTDEHFTSNNEPYSITRGFGTASASTEAFTYDAENDLTSVTDGNDHTTTYTYENGNMTNMVDPDKDETKWTYDGTHDVLTVTTPDGEKTTITRNSNGDAETVSRPAPHSAAQTTTYHYDEHGDLTSVVDPLKHTWSYEYDAEGDCTSSTDPEGDKRTYGYNEDSQRTSIVSPAGNVKGAEASAYTTKMELDQRGRPTTITDPLGHTTQYVYDGNGNIETMTDGNGHTTTYTYDADNEPTKVKEPNGAVTETGYDGAERVTSQTDGNKHTTTYTRNILGEVTEIKDPLGRVTKKEYDAAGNLIAVTDAAKRTTKYSYDPANRLKEVSYSESKTPTVKYEYNGDGERTKMTDGTGTTTYIYDILDRLVKSTNGHGNIAAYEYDLNSNQIKLTYPNNNLVTRTYDNAGRLQSVSDWSGNTTTFAYNPNSDLTTTTFPKGTGEQDKIAYNDADQQMKITMTGSGLKVLAAVAYTRDGDGQVKTTTTTGLPGTASITDIYDANNRLEKSGSTTYAYDTADEPTTLGSNTSVYDAADELKTSGSNIYGYDQLGDRVSATPKEGQATTYGYNQAGDLIQVKQGKANGLNDTYAYNGEGLRASQTKGKATSYVTWDTQVELPLILSDEQNSYIYGPDNIPIEAIQSKGVVLYLHHDQQGSTRMLTSATGAIEATTTYDAYGNTTGTTGNATTPLGYDGQYTDADTGLIYLRARAYDPTTAQFMSVDPIGAITRAPYDYAADNPVNELDPTGLAGCGSIFLVSTVCNELQESGISDAAASTLNFLTLGGSTALAGSVFGFNSACANLGTAGEIGELAGFAFGAFDGEDEALLAKEATQEAEAASPGGTESWGTLLNEIAEATGHHYVFIASSGLAVIGGIGGVGYLIYEKVK
jgi:RHS repeat-associated protein